MKQKNNVVKVIFSVFLVLALYVNSAYASCLDVRDYGYHTYSAGVQILKEYKILTNKVKCNTKNGPATYYFYAIYQDQIKMCVCGKKLQVNQVRVGDDGPYIEYN